MYKLREVKKYQLIKPHDGILLKNWELGYGSGREVKKVIRSLEGGCCSSFNKSWNTFAPNSQTYSNLPAKFIIIFSGSISPLQGTH